VAISNRRLLSYRNGKVAFRYKDYAQEGKSRTMTLPASEFIRRFLLHVLPDGFMRIRHYGYLANRYRREKLEICRRLLGCAASTESPAPMAPPKPEFSGEEGTADATASCPMCKTGRMRITDTFGHLSRLQPGTSVLASRGRTFGRTVREARSPQPSSSTFVPGVAARSRCSARRTNRGVDGLNFCPACAASRGMRKSLSTAAASVQLTSSSRQSATIKSPADPAAVQFSRIVSGVLSGGPGGQALSHRLQPGITPRNRRLFRPCLQPFPFQFQGSFSFAGNRWH
jgi:hypothetical protein